MVDFVAEAIRGVPGVADCRFRLASAMDACSRPDIADTEYAIEMSTGRRNYGWMVLTVEDETGFDAFKAPLHNFANSIAMRLENLEYQNRLEERVREQTAELELSRAFLQSVVDQTADFISVIDPHYTIIRANPAAEAIGRFADGAPGEPVSLEGSKCYAVFFGRATPCADCPVPEAVKGRGTRSTVVPYPNESDPVRWYDISATPLFDEAGRITRILEVGRDVSAMQRMQDELRETAEEKELLLREIHHRVKNNLTMAVSLLKLQFGGFTDERVHAALDASVERIQSMSLVHQGLYQSERQDSIDFRTFVKQIVERLSTTYPIGDAVRVLAEIGDVPVGIETAIPVSLIINELVTNALKYAFPSGRAGVIRVSARALETDVELVVRDDGVGLPRGFRMEETDSLGMRLVLGLAQQIGGTVSASSDTGTVFRVVFPRSGR